MPKPGSMSIGSAPLPAAMISYPDGQTVKKRLRTAPEGTVTLRFRPTTFPTDDSRVLSFARRGPNADYEIKPDLVAVGQQQDAAAAKKPFQGYSGGQFCGPDRIRSGGGPHGLWPRTNRLAVLLAARPHYRHAGGRRGSCCAHAAPGSGIRSLNRALQTTIRALPTAVALGAGSVNLTRTIGVTTVGDAPEEITATAEPFTPEANVTLNSTTPSANRLWWLFYPHHVENPPRAVRINPSAFRALQIRFLGANRSSGLC